MAFFGRDDPFADPFFRSRVNPFEDFYGNRRRPAAIGPSGVGDTNTGMMLSPFGGGMMDPFRRMNDMMRDMHRMSSSVGGNNHSFSQATVMHYSHDSRSGEPPKVYHASVSSRTGPGGINETKKMERDSVSGTQKTSISHQIGDRSRRMDKEYNFKTKEANEEKEFINMDEADAQQFDVEWKQKTQKLNSLYSGSHGNPHAPHRGLPSAAPMPHSSQTTHPSVTIDTGSHGGRKRSPRYTPYQVPSTIDHTHSHTTSTSGEQTQRAKRKKSSQVQFHQ